MKELGEVGVISGPVVEPSQDGCLAGVEVLLPPLILRYHAGFRFLRVVQFQDGIGVPIKRVGLGSITRPSAILRRLLESFEFLG